MRRRAILAAAATLLAIPAAASAALDIETQAAFTPTAKPEIVDVTPDETKMIATQGNQVGVWDVTTPTAPVLRGLAPASTTDIFNVSSVAVVSNRYALAAAQVDNLASGGAERDELWVIDMQPSTPTVLRRIEVADWPDSIAVSPDKTFAAVAIENECEGLPRHAPGSTAPAAWSSATPSLGTWDPLATPCWGKTGGPTATGSIEVIDISNADPANWTVARSVTVPADPDLTDNTDVQPEFIDINSANKAAVTFQENNGVGILDLATGNWDNIWSAGSPSFFTDTTDDAQLVFTTALASTPREPDAVKWISGGTHLMTANEGEAANADNVDEVPAVGGARGYTTWTPGGIPLADVNSAYERTLADFGLVSDDRSDNRGPEPEGLDVATVDSTEFAFLNNERSRAVSMIDLSNVLNPRFVGLAPTGEEPEGVTVLPTKKFVITANEEGGDFTIAKLLDRTAMTTTRPLLWGNNTAFFGATGLGTDTDGTLLFTSQQKPNAINRVTVGAPGYAPFTQPIQVDTALSTGQVQDITPAPGGGYWIVASGVSAGAHSGSDLFKISATGAVQSAVAIGTTTKASGVAVSADGGTVYVSANDSNVITRHTVAGGAQATFTLTKVGTASDSRIQDLTMASDGGLLAVESTTPGGGSSTLGPAYVLNVAAPGTATGTITATTVKTVTAAEQRATRSMTGITVRGSGDVWTLNGTRTGRAGNTDLRLLIPVAAASAGSSPGGSSSGGSSSTAGSAAQAAVIRAAANCVRGKKVTTCTVTTKVPGARVWVLRGSRIVTSVSSGSLGVARVTVRRVPRAGKLRFLVDGRPLAVRLTGRG